MPEINTIRLKNLEKLLKKYPNKTAFGNAIDTQNSYICHLIAGRRTLGDKFCRKVESSLNLPKNWMDKQH